MSNGPLAGVAESALTWDKGCPAKISRVFRVITLRKFVLLGSAVISKLESIGIYTDPGDWAGEHFPSLDKELEGIAMEESRNARKLHAVVVCDSTHAGNIETDKLQAACAANGIYYSDDGSKYLFYCGNETVWGDLYHWVRGGDREQRFKDRDPGRVIPGGWR
ncbi:hypothetical protein BJX65DRAFT_315470 [Aspergillus insuetus]